MKHKLYIGNVEDDGGFNWFKIGEYDTWKELEKSKSILSKLEEFKNRPWRTETTGAQT